jgi:glycosyltransferase involved in cell wall biosynthesis
MRLCVDGRLAGDGTGVHQYSNNLLRVLRAGGANPLTLDFGNTASPRRASAGVARLRRWSGALRQNPRPVDVPIDTDSALRLVGGDLYREARAHFRLYNRLMPISVSGPPGVMHWTYPVPLYMHGWRNLYTVHDVIPLQDAGFSTIPAKRHRRLLHRIMQRADRVLTVSETARADIVALTRCSADLVVNAYQTVDGPDGINAPPPDGYQSGSYFLFCGRIESRKNLNRLVQAHQRSGSHRPLVIVGPVSREGEQIRKMLAEVPNVHILPFQDRATLLGFIRHARALLFPSLAEGFGLPVVEAMTLGTPVMISTIDSLKEVAGDAALSVDPFDEKTMGDVIAQLCSNDTLCDQLGTLGLARATHFSHNLYYERLLAIYTQADAQTPRQSHLIV